MFFLKAWENVPAWGCSAIWARAVHRSRPLDPWQRRRVLLERNAGMRAASLLGTWERHGGVPDDRRRIPRSQGTFWGPVTLQAAETPTVVHLSFSGCGSKRHPVGTCVYKYACICMQVCVCCVSIWVFMCEWCVCVRVCEHILSVSLCTSIRESLLAHTWNV